MPMKCGWHQCDNCDNFLMLKRRKGAPICAQKGAVNYRLPSGISRQNIEDDYEVDVFFYHPLCVDARCLHANRI